MSHNLRTSFNFDRSFISPVIALAALIIVVLGCGSSTPAPSEYVGSWTGEDGTTMTIRANGSADYKSANASVDNGGLTVDTAAKTLKITFAGMGPSFTIDKSPSGNQMTLSGVVFKKGGSSDSTSDTSSPKAPSDDKVQSLVKNTMLDFSDAIKNDDFSSFISKSAKPFKDEASDEKMRKNFRGFIDSKMNFAAVKNLTANFSKPPSIDTSGNFDVLIADGSFPTTPNKTKFVFKYINEDGDWKLIGINVDTTKD